MEKMKYDMAAAGHAGAMRAIALLKPRVPVIAIVCAAENMPTARPTNPATCDRDVREDHHVINTDAEGRLVLADA